MWIIREGDNRWYSFKYQAFHDKGIDMKAGQTIVFNTEVNFAQEDLLPTDYSVVAWATEQEVQMTTTGDDTDSTFPNFQLDETIQQYNWNHEPIEAGDDEQEA